MTVGAIVQARLASRRLPNKVLAPLAGRPALALLLERLQRATGIDGLLVATSEDASDRPLVAFCEEAGVTCHRGPLDDVATRMLDAARTAGFDAFARINGDSPLPGPALVSRGIELMRTGEADLVTNVRPRTFPPGQSVEVLRSEALAEVLRGSVQTEHREHVTGPLDEGGFRIMRFQAAEPRTDVHLALDTVADQTRLEAILKAMDRPHWDYGWQEMRALA